MVMEMLTHDGESLQILEREMLGNVEKDCRGRGRKPVRRVR